MAERRMFAKTIIDSDAFLDMPLSTQALYFHLSMRADDEGFINNPRKIQRMIGASDDDLRLLATKNFIIPFESGVVVIKHWKIHNYIRNDRLQKTQYQEERELLDVKENGAYTIARDINEIPAIEKRRIAYDESELPYCFTYKIRRAFDGKICPICGCEMKSSSNLTIPSIQHNKPISKGGKHTLDNISVVCNSCNCSIKDNETGELNNAEVIKTWQAIIIAEDNNIDWFYNTKLLDDIDVRQMSVKCPSNVGIGKDSIGKVSKGKDSIGKDIAPSQKPKKEKYGELGNVKLTIDEYDKLLNEYGSDLLHKAIKYLDEYIEDKGNKYKSHYMTMRRWVFDAVKEQEQKRAKLNNSGQGKPTFDVDAFLSKGD